MSILDETVAAVVGQRCRTACMVELADRGPKNVSLHAAR